MKYFFYIIILCGVYYWFWLHQPSVSYGPGMVAPKEPKQELIDSSKEYPFKGYKLKAVAKFLARARVLHKKHYRFDDESDLIPYDLALGWGRMSDEDVLDNIKFSQSNRFYFWKTRRYPIPHDEIVHSSANFHFIPANDGVLDTIRQVKTGNVILFKGYLVNVYRKDGVARVTSTTRKDDGAGACEIVFAKHFKIIDPKKITPVGADNFAK